MTRTAEIVERLRDVNVETTPLQLEAADHMESLARERDRAVEALRYYACEGGPSVPGDDPKDWFLCHKTDREPVETLYDLGYRARRVLAEIDADAPAEEE